MARVVITDELFHPLPFYYADDLLSIDILKENLWKDNLKGKKRGDRFLFLNCADKDYWIQQVVKQSSIVEATHPLIDKGNLLERVEQLTEEMGHIEVFYEYFDPETNLSNKISQLGGLYYCNAYCHVRDEIALEQALLELIDWFTLNMSPIDEVLCRSRSHTGRNQRPDCCTVLLKFADGMEAHWFISALGEEESRGIRCIGPKGTYYWDGGIVDKGIRRQVESGALNNTYRIVDWIHRSARSERSITYKDSKR